MTFSELLHFLPRLNVIESTVYPHTAAKVVTGVWLVTKSTTPCCAGHDIVSATQTVIPLMPSQDEQHTQSAAGSSKDNAVHSDGHYATCCDDVGQFTRCDNDHITASDEHLAGCPANDQSTRSVGQQAEHEHQVHGPVTLQQAVANGIEKVAFDAGSSDNLAVVVLDITPSSGLQTRQSAQQDPTLTTDCQASHIIDASPQLECVHLPAQQREAATDNRIEATSGHSAAVASCTQADQTLNAPADDQVHHALPSELFELQKPDLPDVPGMTLWLDNSQVALGTLVGHAESHHQYRLLDQVAQLPRYSDHVHTSWTGLPILSSTSLWLQPHWPSSATSTWLTSPHTDTDKYPNARGLWPGQCEQDLSLHRGSSQLMLSPGSMLQLVSSHTPASRLWDARSGKQCTVADSANDDTHCGDRSDWLSSAATAVARVAAALPADIASSQSSSGGHSLPAYERAAGMHLGAIGSHLQSVHAKASDLQGEWQRYERGRNFARGSFGEVWHAEQTPTGKRVVHALHSQS